MNVVYRECVDDDFEHLLPLFLQLWPGKKTSEGKMREVFDRGIASKGQHYLCAEVDGRIVGFCSLTVKNSFWLEGYSGSVDEIVVDEEFRRRGIGTELLTRVIDISRRMGCGRIELDSAHHRTGAHAFYSELGFENRALLFSKVLAGRRTVAGDEDDR